MRKEDFIFAALTPTLEGPPLLALPTTFEVGDPAGYYQTVIVGRLERAADNAYWETAHRAQLRPLAAGGAELEYPGGAGGGLGAGDPAENLKAGGGKARLPPEILGALTSSEITESVKHGPNDSKGKPKCWDAACHDGCAKTATTCTRSHLEGIKNADKAHWTVKAQYIKRGGLGRAP